VLVRSRLVTSATSESLTQWMWWRFVVVITVAVLVAGIVIVAAYFRGSRASTVDIRTAGWVWLGLSAIAAVAALLVTQDLRVLSWTAPVLGFWASLLKVTSSGYVRRFTGKRATNKTQEWSIAERDAIDFFAWIFVCLALLAQVLAVTLRP
jgi:hypothetical protein